MKVTGGETMIVGTEVATLEAPPAPCRPNRSPGRRLMRLAILIVLATLALSAPIWQLQGNNVYDTNLKADYLRARALRDGRDIFVSIDSLAARYFPERGIPFPDQSPHPPVLPLLFVPTTFLSFPAFCTLWVVLNLILLLLVGRWLRLSPLATLALGAWPPLFLTLKSFQWELILLALILASWRDAERGQDGRAGIWLGLAGVIKFYPLFLLLPFLLGRRFCLVTAAGLVFALGQVGSLLAVGPHGLWRYYTDVLPHLGTVAYAGTLVDTSIHGMLLRLFPGSPGLVLTLTAFASLLALYALARLRVEAGPLAIMLLLPTYVLSIYLTLALPLIISLWRERRLRALVIPATVLASFPYFTVNGVIHLPELPWLLGSVEPLGYLGLILATVIIQYDRSKA